jgi:hypothetical protein
MPQRPNRCGYATLETTDKNPPIINNSSDKTKESFLVSIGSSIRSCASKSDSIYEGVN